jgi:hypothetical protein
MRSLNLAVGSDARVVTDLKNGARTVFVGNRYLRYM